LADDAKIEHGQEHPFSPAHLAAACHTCPPHRCTPRPPSCSVPAPASARRPAASAARLGWEKKWWLLLHCPHVPPAAAAAALALTTTSCTGGRVTKMTGCTRGRVKAEAQGRAGVGGTGSRVRRGQGCGLPELDATVGGAGVGRTGEPGGGGMDLLLELHLLHQCLFHHEGLKMENG
jgi:hypothetical protein